MALVDDLRDKVREFATTRWGQIANGLVVPTPESLTFGNTGTRILATVLYADIRGSTNMVDSISDTLAAEYYKAFLHCAAKIIKQNSGTITAYDGDRVMAIFVGDSQGRDAVTTGLQINWAMNNIINPEFSQTYPQSHRPLKHTIGIDHGTVLAAKTGVRVDSDLVWVGPPANYAAKLNSFEGLDGEFPMRATRYVVDQIGLDTFTRISDNTSIWDGPFKNLDRGAHYRTKCEIAL